MMCRGMRGIAWAPLALLAFLTSAAAGQHDTDLLRALDLGGYQRGERPPEFRGRTVDGQHMSLAGLRGKVVLVTFWATWCSPCRQEMSLLERLHRELAREGLAVVGVNAREDRSAIVEYANGLELTFPLLVDRKGEIQSSYGVIGLPTTFLIARDGRAVARAIGPRDWGGPQARALVRALLVEPGQRK
jgi:peroxiredoxin